MSTGFLVATLQGGLGNQLFQYAAGLAIKREIEKRGLSITLWLTAAEENKHSGRDYRSGLYGMARPLQGETGEPVSSDPHTLWYPSDSFLAWRAEDMAAVMVGGSSLVIRGYFQYLPAIRSVLPLLRHDLLKRCTEQRIMVGDRYAIQDPRAVGFLHVRRGDYVELEHEGFWLQKEEYYMAALEAVGPAAPQRYFVVSDDPAWCRTQEWISSDSRLEVVDEPDELKALLLMSLCEGAAIIANSTFSWWGAWLGAAAAGAPVVYPARWYRFVKPELFPEGWRCV